MAKTRIHIQFTLDSVCLQRQVNEKRITINPAAHQEVVSICVKENGDDLNDIVSSDYEGNRIYLFIMDKTRNTLTLPAITSGNHPKGVAIADLNGDGKGDIVVCNNADDSISIIWGK